MAVPTTIELLTNVRGSGNKLRTDCRFQRPSSSNQAIKIITLLVSNETESSIFSQTGQNASNRGKIFSVNLPIAQYILNE